MIQLFINEDKIESHRFTVQNRSGKILYLIEGYWGKKNDIVNLFNLQGHLLLQAKQVTISPFFKFDLLHKKEKIGSFRKHSGFFGFRDAYFTVQPKNWIIKGDFEKLNFTAFENNQKIITTNKLLKHANFLYSLKVKKEEDIALASLLAILLDHYSRTKEKEKKFNEISQENYKLGFMNYHIHSRLTLKKEELEKQLKS